MQMMLCHLSGSLKGQTQFIDADRVTFGTSGTCGVRFSDALDPAVRYAHADLMVEHGVPILRDRTGKHELFVNGLRQTEAALQDGDLVQFGEAGPEVRFRVSADGGAPVKPLRSILADSRDILVRSPHPRYLSPFYLTRHLISDVLLHASPWVKMMAGLAVLAPLILIIWLGIALHGQQQAGMQVQKEMAELIHQLETGRLSQAELEQRIERERQATDAARRRGEAQIAALTAKLKASETARESRQEIQAVRQQLEQIRQAQNFAEDIARRFGESVGLLQGGYGFKEKSTGRPLRYQGLDQLGNPFVDRDGNALVTLEGTAPPVLIYFAGTAFLADQAGIVVTNRHLVRMWELYQPAQQAIEAGFEPEMVLLRVFFPHDEQPYRLTEITVSEHGDIALLRTERTPKTASMVPLARKDPLRIGEPIVMLSYPGSVDTLLARAPKTVSQAIVAQSGRDSVRLIDELARNQLIRPLATQGIISDVAADLITYEAVSASGSSGAPLFDGSGRVIGVNQAKMQRIEGVHLALPVRFVTELLAAASAPPTR